MKVITYTLVAMMAVMPVKISADEPPPGDEPWALAACIIVATGIAVGAVVFFAKKCEPQYYWLMDDSEQPPKYWVATCTKKEAEVSGWKRIGGPYKRPTDAPIEHPSPTNRVDHVISPYVRITVQQSTNLVEWVPLSSTTGYSEDFAYFPTNAAGFYRYEIGAP